ncbi:hypothetical protein BT69DRAFT_1050845 [Atractiella rhizophila]|nr:hypothetical protein BT69DRAFT_1255692 [Atractiella rhizophila]KAH8930073.1 hypothetical protein BT69DRAFT_1050845 [Atractiella rhizophila]
MEATNEETHVHSVYSHIASHFSQTRYKPWPNVDKFLTSLPSNSIVLDAGCGNGKYLGTRSVLSRTLTPSSSKGKIDGDVSSLGFIFSIGVDRSEELLGIARGRGHEVFRTDVGGGMENCVREGVFDAAISIATIHHFTSHHRRCEAVKALMLAIKPSSGSRKGGRALIHVWALEQDEAFFKKRGMEPASLSISSSHSATDSDTGPSCSHHGTSLSIGLHEGEEGIKDRTQDWLVPWTTKEGGEERMYKRFYHLFKQGELEGMVENAAKELGWAFTGKDSEDDDGGAGGEGFRVRIVDGGWEKDNWFVELLIFRYSS